MSGCILGAICSSVIELLLKCDGSLDRSLLVDLRNTSHLSQCSTADVKKDDGMVRMTYPLLPVTKNSP